MSRPKEQCLTAIDDVESLRKHLQTAIELEHATIPTYLCALYSIKDGHNREAAELIQGVVMEEMLHMSLAANLLNAMNGEPAVDDPKFIPEYPTSLPHSAATFQVGLLKFSPGAIKTFLRIERPARAGAPPEPDRYHTIGQFYKAIQLAIRKLEEEAQKQGKTIFTGPPERQVLPEHYYYGGGGRLVVVRPPTKEGDPSALDLTLKALEEIKEQGEGIDHTIFDGDGQFDQEAELAHYFRFNQILAGRYYRNTDTPKKPPTGATLPVDWDAVWNMALTPRVARYKDQPEIYAKLVEFNRAYTRLLRLLHAGFTGAPERLLEAVPMMYELKYLAVALMKIPSGTGRATVGPSFEYWVD